MAIIEKAIRLETTKQNLVQAVIAKQGDSNSRYLRVTFLDEGTVIPLDSSSQVTINAEREDGASESFFGVINGDDTATVPLHSWILELAGVVNCDISIIGTDSRLTTTTFVVKVEKAACSSGDISTDPQYDVLANLINDVNAAKNGTANAIVGTVSGSVVSMTDVSPLEHNIGVKLESKNVLDLTSIIGKSVTENGGTLSCGADGGITGSGTLSGYVGFGAFRLYLPKGKYILSASGTFSNFGCYFVLRDANNSILLEGGSAFSGGVFAFDLADYPSFSYVSVTIKRNKDAAMSGTAYFQLEKGTTASEYTPFLPAEYDKGGVYIQGVRKSEVVETVLEDDTIYTLESWKNDDGGELEMLFDKNGSCQISTNTLGYVPAELQTGTKLYYDAETDSLYHWAKCISSVTLKKYGKNLIKYPYADNNPVTRQGITFTTNADGTVTANGTSTGFASFGLDYGAAGLVLKKGVTYTISGVEHTDKYAIYVTGATLSTANANSCRVTPTQDTPITAIRCVVYTGSTVNNLVFKPQIEIGTTATEYEPYKAPAPVSVNEDGSANIIGNGEVITLMTDTEGVTITAEYNKDLNKVVNDIYQKLSAFGVAVVNN